MKPGRDKRLCVYVCGWRYVYICAQGFLYPYFSQLYQHWSWSNCNSIFCKVLQSFVSTLKLKHHNTCFEITHTASCSTRLQHPVYPYLQLCLSVSAGCSVTIHTCIVISQETCHRATWTDPLQDKSKTVVSVSPVRLPTYCVRPW